MEVKKNIRPLCCGISVVDRVNCNYSKIRLKKEENYGPKSYCQRNFEYYGTGIL